MMITQRNVAKTITVLGIVLLFAVGFMLLGMLIDIQIISKHDYTPISFTFTLLFCGILLGVFWALRTVSHRTRNS